VGRELDKKIRDKKEEEKRKRKCIFGDCEM
jgi:hypothetical protein